ncbi:hypothetical protein GQ44DRAFT_707001 [Phaeosphaeriaceae sp. PMI808]|nr:hypothetical protein GQ44DRAFT_707001 [Phaeosphaeriaceae sp. PMI808]
MDSPQMPLESKQDFGLALSPVIASVDTHTMGDSLFKYLHMKIHPDIDEKEWAAIIVKGHHSRAGSSCVAVNEKTDKPFNWQRPTTHKPREDVLELLCFPGLDYVEHYAAIVATYLSLKQKSTDVVSHHLPTPFQRMEPLVNSNLKNMGQVDVAILGYVHRLDRFTSGGTWEGDDDNELFSWKIKTMANGTKVAFIGCRICFWGDIGGNVVRTLQQINNIKCAIYIGKLGTLRSEYRPNTILATGSSSVVYGTPVSWTNVLANATRGSTIVKHGPHYSLPSVLEETKEWLEDKKASYDWVDPEIGQMGKASNEGGTSFGFLHIVSDNLAQKYAYDLSNERERQVVQSRKILFAEINEIMDKFLQEWDSRQT